MEESSLFYVTTLSGFVAIPIVVVEIKCFYRHTLRSETTFGPLKMMKNAFYFILKAPFVFKHLDFYLYFLVM